MKKENIVSKKDSNSGNSFISAYETADKRIFAITTFNVYVF